MLMTSDTPHGPITKFLKKCTKNKGKNLFSQFGFWFENFITIQACMQKIREKSLYRVRNPPHLCLEMCTFSFVFHKILGLIGSDVYWIQTNRQTSKPYLFKCICQKIEKSDMVFLALIFQAINSANFLG